MGPRLVDVKPHQNTEPPTIAYSVADWLEMRSSDGVMAQDAPGPGPEPPESRTLETPSRLYCGRLEVSKPMVKLSRRELARLAAGMTAAGAVRVDAQTPASSPYVGPLTGLEKVLRPAFRSRCVHARTDRRCAAASPIPGAHPERGRKVAEDTPVEADRARRRFPGGAPTASTDHTRDAFIFRLHTREDCVRQ